MISLFIILTAVLVSVLVVTVALVCENYAQQMRHVDRRRTAITRRAVRR